MLGIHLALENPELDFVPTACPYCHNVENLDSGIDGNWECEVCGAEYFVLHLRAVVPSEKMADIHTASDVKKRLTLSVI